MRGLLIGLSVLLLGSCASAAKHCSGFTPGSAGYQACAAQVAEYNAQRRMAFGAALKQTGDSMNARSQQYYTPAPRAGTSGCFLKSQQVSGFNRICIYDCLGSANATTIGATDLCPLSM